MKVLIDDFYEVVLALEDVSGTVCWPVREWCISWILGSVCASVPRYLWSQCCVCSVAFLVLLYFLLDTTFRATCGVSVAFARLRFLYFFTFFLIRRFVSVVAFSWLVLSGIYKP